MRNVNKVTLIGYLAADPVLSYSTSGNPYTRISIATNYQRKTASGTYENEAEFHRVICWGKIAERIAEFLKKGAAVYVEGRISTRTWKDEEGNNKFRKDIVAQTVNFLDGKHHSQQAQASATVSENLAQNDIQDEAIPETNPQELKPSRRRVKETASAN